MLPTPNTFSRVGRRQLHKTARRWTSPELWATRSRLSNSAVGAIVSLAILSLFLNIHLYRAASTAPAAGASSEPPAGPERGWRPWRFGQDGDKDKQAPWSGMGGHGGFGGGMASPQRLERAAATKTLTHLVIVPGHAIWRGTRPELRMADDQWALAPFQKGKDRVRAFFSHIIRGAEISLQDSNSLLIFSGGQTHSTSSQTEAQSYLRLALLSNAFHDPEFEYGDESSTVAHHPAPFPRATTEDFALDSFQNLAFSIARFHEFTGHYPSNITIVGYEMKRKRFEQLHRAALRWPADRFHYVGIGLDPANEKEAWDGEVANALAPYTKDMYGCHPPLLTKRLERNPSARVHPYGQTVLPFHVSAEEHGLRMEQHMVARLLSWCPPDGADWTAVYDGPLPWDT